MNKTKKLTTAAIMVALVVIMSLVFYIAPFMLVFIPVVGVPVVLSGKVLDIKTQLLLCLASVILIIMTTDLIYGLGMGLVLLAPAVVQGFMFKKDKSASLTIVYGGVAMFFGILGMLYLIETFSSHSIIEQFQMEVNLVADQTKVLYESIGLFPEDQIDQLKSLIDEAREVFLTVIPSLLATMALFSNILMYVVTRSIAKRMKLDYKHYYFKDFRVNKDGRFIIMLIMIGVTLAYYFDRVNGFYYVSNFFVLFTLILRFNALSFLWYLADRHPNKTGMKVIVVLIYVVPSIIPGLQFLVYLSAFIGFADMYGDLRKRIEAKSK